ncbi:phosphocholine-specific phospholipase C [Jeongeupia naejangsanensis]|uniref:phospholipase C n=1 Tax=Jeongeupia naejangsanensis TaxID=613195 RepID=A0ABS2BP52_9NEIS|nr:phospholipase C, phosphocholine-specific [Jeongeupia naejangsanensis]MBM3117421.1 phospholipase C, phosphocholine-specific [Jeongeupia naejangsanensis]
MTTFNRRKFLQAAAIGSTMAMFPPAIRRALAIPANNATGTINDVMHVVILTQENRSFDNYFGTLPGVRGFGDRFSIPVAGGKSVWEQSNGTRVVMPYHLDSSKGNAQRVSGTPHSWGDAHTAWDDGRMNQWPRYKTNASMGYYKEAELGFQFALANAFTLCDAYHCSVHAGTNPNRLFLWTGTNGPTGAGVAAVVNEWDDLGPSGTGYTWTTYPERLQQAGVSWKVYQNLPENFGDNPLAGFRQYRKANEAIGNTSAGSPYIPYAAGHDAISPLYKGVGNTMPDGGFLDSLRADVAAGSLPQVSWIVAPATYSEHPGPSSPIQGAWYIQQVLEALTANPEVWSRTVLLVNFDENDGFFDHVPSPSAPSLNPDGSSAGLSTVDDAFERYTHPVAPGTTSQPAPDKRVYGPGPRVPMYVISPWSRGGWVNSQVFDHTSVIRFLEQRFGVFEPNISAWRRAVCGDLTSAFNFVNPNTEKLPAMPALTRSQADTIRAQQQALAQVALPAEAQQQRPVQQPGVRPSRALPYELHVSARADTAVGGVRLIFSNTGTAGAVFHVYDRLHLDRIPRRYTVEAGKQLDDLWDTLRNDAGKYDLWVLGPNGFHRGFQGDTAVVAAGGANPEIRVCYEVAGNAVYLTMLNTGTAACTFTVRPNAYRQDGPWVFDVPAGMQIEQHWQLGWTGGWYDFSVSAAGGFSRRFAGRIETGRHSNSDPAMGMPG